MKMIAKLTIAMMCLLSAAACTSGTEANYRSSTAQGSYYFEPLDN